MATEPNPSPAVWQDRMTQWLHAQTRPGAPPPDPDPDSETDVVILRPAWPRIFPPL